MILNLRRKAALFYYKSLTNAQEDWVEGRSGGEIDPDVVALANLLTDVHQIGYQDGFMDGSQRGRKP